MDETLGDLPFVAVYADDMCVHDAIVSMMREAEVFRQHLQHLETLLHRLAKAGICHAPDKKRMAVKQNAFSGHLVDGEGMFPQHPKVEAVVNMPPPAEVAGLRRFLGMMGYYGKFHRASGCQSQAVDQAGRPGTVGVGVKSSNVPLSSSR